MTAMFSRSGAAIVCGVGLLIAAGVGFSRRGPRREVHHLPLFVMIMVGGLMMLLVGFSFLLLGMIIVLLLLLLLLLLLVVVVVLLVLVFVVVVRTVPAVRVIVPLPRKLAVHADGHSPAGFPKGYMHAIVAS